MGKSIRWSSPPPPVVFIVTILHYICSYMCFPSVSLQNHSVSYPHCFLWYFPCCFLVSLGWSVIFKDTTASWDPGKVLKNLIEFLNSVSVSSKLVIHVSQASKVLPKHYGMTCRNGKKGASGNRTTSPAAPKDQEKCERKQCTFVDMGWFWRDEKKLYKQIWCKRVIMKNKCVGFDAIWYQLTGGNK